MRKINRIKNKKIDKGYQPWRIESNKWGMNYASSSSKDDEGYDAEGMAMCNWSCSSKGRESRYEGLAGIWVEKHTSQDGHAYNGYGNGATNWCLVAWMHFDAKNLWLQLWYRAPNLTLFLCIASTTRHDILPWQNPFSSPSTSSRILLDVHIMFQEFITSLSFILPTTHIQISSAL